MRLLALLLWLLPGVAPAQELPALFAVTGVASDDVLNIRAAPDAGAEILGTLAPDARGVEAVEASGGWLRVNAGERSGWASARFLARTGPDWSAGLPAHLTCVGTEPFWSLSTAPDGASLGGPAFVSMLQPMWSGPAAGRGPVEFGALWGAGGTPAVSAAIRREACSDGMSDRAFGLSILLIEHGRPRALSGCCSLAP